jgi:hypothetical protein
MWREIPGAADYGPAQARVVGRIPGSKPTGLAGSGRTLEGEEMTPQEQVMFARYKESTLRSDDTIVALEKVVLAQREVIDLLHAQIGRMEGQLAELRAAL